MAGAEGQAEKQGYLGNLEKKSRTELQDLLTRQEKLLNNEVFISRLPDKGKRIRELTERLRSALSWHAKVDGTADMLERMAIDADYKHRSRATVRVTEEVEEGADILLSRSRATVRVTEEVEEGADILKDIVNKEIPEKMVEDNRDEGSGKMGHRTFWNSYEKVIRNVETHQVEEGSDSGRKFKPYRSIKTQHIYEVPGEKLQHLKQGDEPQHGSADPSIDSKNLKRDMESKMTKSVESSVEERKTIPVEEDGLHNSSGNKSKLKHHYDDSLEMDMSIGPLHHCPTKLITVEESVRVLEQQQKLHKELQAKQAAERLAQRLHIKVGDFNPEGAVAASITYREPVEKSDSEHSDSELDYPD